MKSLVLVFSAVAMLLGVGSACASVTYDFTGQNLDYTSTDTNPLTENFILTVPSAITANQTINSGTAGLSCNGCSSVQFFPDAVSQGFTATPSQAITWGTASGGSDYYYFNPGSFTHNGTYSSILLAGTHDATLVVSGISSVPVPSSIYLMISGFGLLGAIARRKKAVWSA